MEQAPVVLKEGVDKKTAEEIKKTLEDGKPQPGALISADTRCAA